MGEYFLRLARNGHFLLLGLGSVADMSGQSLVPITCQEEEITSLIGRDFQAVGNDIHFAMSQWKALMTAKNQQQLELALR